MIVNAGPPLGILASVPCRTTGSGRRAPTACTPRRATRSASHRPLCNEQAAAENYPEATLASCKAMFRNVWASVDDGCDASPRPREAARAVYDCRAATCETALGDDDVCVAEEEAFRDAEVAYGACLASAAATP